jgi:hypothetical protein
VGKQNSDEVTVRQIEPSKHFCGAPLRLRLFRDCGKGPHVDSGENAQDYPERFAQEALGHNSKAVHRAYAKRALMKIPSLEDYEQRAAAKIV